MRGQELDLSAHNPMEEVVVATAVEVVVEATVVAEVESQKPTLPTKMLIQQEVLKL